ncbi:MAG TPA: DUF927 domain-containing protein [Ktedonobacterales bacterium]|nr:DUF927 domain-containing protein [Ktedonobacterales bacterium]
MLHQQMRDYCARAIPWDGKSHGSVVWSAKIPDPDRPGHWKMKTEPGKEHEPVLRWNSRSVTTVDECLKAINWATPKPETAGIYLGQSLLRDEHIRTSKRGYPYRESIRQQWNVVALHSLFADVDVKPGAYETREQAIQGVLDFIRAAGLPGPNMMVGSGSGGLHVYWIMDRALSRDEWRPLAFAFAEATRRHGLKCDSQCSVDSVRILRIPGTFNHKADPKPVTFELNERGNHSVEAIAKALEPYMVAVPAIAAAEQVFELPSEVNPKWSAMADNFGANQEPDEFLVDLTTVAPSCAFVKEALDTGGAAFANPLWNLSTLLATFAIDGRDMAHKMACGHVGYSHERTDELFDRKVREREAKNLGWPKCQSIQNAGCASCATCPLLSSGKSPLNFAVRPTPAPAPQASVPPAGAPVISQPTGIGGGANLPEGYVHDPQGLVCWLKPAKDGSGTEAIPVADFPIVSAWVQKEPWWLHFTIITGVPPKPREISISFKEAQITNDLLRCVSDQGIMLPGPQITLFKEFLVSWNARLQKIAGGAVESTPFGWTIENGKVEGFAYGGRVWMKGGKSRPAAASGAKFKAQYTPRGEFSVWQDAMRLITGQKRPALDVILAASFGAPLMKFTGQSGLIIAAIGESGIGKSAAMDVAQAVWGKGVISKDGLEDTNNSIGGKMGALRHLPVFWDEIKTSDQTQRFVKIAFQLSSGKEKSRLRSDGSQREAGEWQTLLMAASNDSILDAVASETKTSTAGINRLFEFRVPGMPESARLPGAHVARVIDRGRENFGQAGLEYAKWLGANPDVAANMVAKVQDHLFDELKANPEERFWIAAITVCAAGASIANTLNITDIDIDPMMDFMKSVVGKLRAERSASAIDMTQSLSVSSIVQQYLAAMSRGHTIVTDRVTSGPGRPGKNKINTTTDTAKLDGVYVQLATEPGILRISRAHFRKWLSQNGYTPGAILSALQGPPFLANINASGILGAGTSLVRGAQEVLVEFCIHGTEFEGLLNPLELPAPANVA